MLAVAAGAAIVGTQTCPGSIEGSGTGTQDNYCCVGGNVTVSVCAGWPICTGPTTVDLATRTPTCATTVPLTASNYDAQVSSASSKYLDKDGKITASAGGGSGSNSGPTATGTGVTATGQDSATSTSNSGAGVTAAAMLAPIYGGVLAYAAMQ